MTSAEFLESLAPVIAAIGICGAPIVWLLLHHQRKMAEFIHGNRAQPGEIEQLRQQVQQLAGLVHQNTIQLDELRRLQGASASELEPRLRG